MSPQKSLHEEELPTFWIPYWPEYVVSQARRWRLSIFCESLLVVQLLTSLGVLSPRAGCCGWMSERDSLLSRPTRIRPFYQDEEQILTTRREFASWEMSVQCSRSCDSRPSFHVVVATSTALCNECSWWEVLDFASYQLVLVDVILTNNGSPLPLLWGV